MCVNKNETFNVLWHLWLPAARSRANAVSLFTFLRMRTVIPPANSEVHCVRSCGGNVVQRIACYVDKSPWNTCMRLSQNSTDIDCTSYRSCILFKMGT